MSSTIGILDGAEHWSETTVHAASPSSHVLIHLSRDSFRVSRHLVPFGV